MTFSCTTGLCPLFRITSQPEIVNRLSLELVKSALLSRPVDGIIFVEYSDLTRSEALANTSKPAVPVHQPGIQLDRPAQYYHGRDAGLRNGQDRRANPPGVGPER